MTLVPEAEFYLPRPCFTIYLCGSTNILLHAGYVHLHLPSSCLSTCVFITFYFLFFPFKLYFSKGCPILVSFFYYFSDFFRLLSWCPPGSCRNWAPFLFLYITSDFHQRQYHVIKWKSASLLRYLSLHISLHDSLTRKVPFVFYLPPVGIP